MQAFGGFYDLVYSQFVVSCICISGKPKLASKFVNNVFKVASGNIVAQGIGILVTPILTRLFPPDAFGIAALLTSFSAVMGMVSSLRYEHSILLVERDDEAANILFLSLSAVFVMAVTTGLIVFFSGGFICQKLNYHEMGKYLWMLPAAVLVKGALLVFDYWNSRTKNFNQLAFARILSSIVMRAGKLGSGFAGYVTGGALFAADVIGYLISALFVARRIWMGNRLMFMSGVRWQRILLVLKRYRRFPIYGTWSVLLVTISQQLPSLMLAFFFSPRIVGFFALSRQLVGLPVNLIALSIKQVFFQEAVSAKYEGNLEIVIEKVLVRLVSLSIFPFLLIAVFGKELFSGILGADWRESGVYAQFISPWMFLFFISTPLKAIFSVLEAQAEEVLLNWVFFLFCFGSLIVGGALGDPRMAVGLYSLAGLIISSFMCYRVLSIVRVDITKCLRKVKIYVMVCILLIAVNLGFRCILQLSGLVLVGSCCLSGLIYYALVLYIDVDMRSHLGMLFRNRVAEERVFFHEDI